MSGLETLVINKKARHEYSIDSVYMAGVVLSGPEVKTLRNKSASLSGSFVKVLGGEAYLINAQLTPYKFADNSEYDPKRNRKLLLKKKQLLELAEKLGEKNWTLVPLRFVKAGKFIKLEIGLGRGLKQYEKRDKLKKRDQQREISRLEKNNW